MSEDEVIKKLKIIFKSIFSKSDFTFSRNLGAKDIDDIGLSNHVNLIMAIEKNSKYHLHLMN